MIVEVGGVETNYYVRWNEGSLAELISNSNGRESVVVVQLGIRCSGWGES